MFIDLEDVYFDGKFFRHLSGVWMGPQFDAVWGKFENWFPRGTSLGQVYVGGHYIGQVTKEFKIVDR
jgi:hypothetical protein